MSHARVALLLLLCASCLAQLPGTPALPGSAATAAPTPVSSSTPSPVSTVTPPPLVVSPSSPAVTVSPSPVTATPLPSAVASSPVPTAAAVPPASPVQAPQPPAEAPVASPSATPSPTPATTPAATPSAAQTALDAVIRLTGPAIWPFDTTKQQKLVAGLGGVMQTVTMADMSVTSATQFTSFSTSGRKLRQSSAMTAADVTVQFVTTSKDRVAAVSQELSNIITNGKLQAALSSQGISTSTVALVSTSQVVPTSRTDCAAGVVAGECIGGTKNSSALQLWLIIVIAVGCTAALGAFVVIVVFCCCRHRRAKQARQESMRRNYIEPTHAKPFNYPEFAKTNSPQGPATPVVADAASPAHAHPVLQMQPVRSPLAMGAGVAMGTDAIMRIPEASLKDGAMYISPKDSLAGVERIAAANAQLRGFQAKLTTANAQLAVRRLLQKHQLEEQRLADPGATGWNVMKLHAALQYLTNTFTFAGKYIMQGGKFKGSNCVVARGREMEAFGSRPVTIKFFVDAQEFVHEKRFHQQARSKNHIPAVLDTFEAGEVSMTSDGVKNPACIVLERGEYTLSHFLTRMDRNPGSLGSKDILVALAEAVNYLHSRNIVHRGISADSLMWFDSTSRWRLAEFGSWGRRGADAPLSYTLRTAAPEVVAADAMGMLAWTRMVPHRAADTLGPTYFVVDPASDVWAIGVVAWELFTGRQLFADNFSDEDVMAMLLGLKALPFEADPSLWVLFRDSQAANLVKGLLQRQPEDRLLIRELLSAAANLTDN